MTECQYLYSRIQETAKENRIQDEHLEELVHCQKFTSVVLNHLLKAGKMGGWGGIELLRASSSQKRSGHHRTNFLLKQIYVNVLAL